MLTVQYEIDCDACGHHIDTDRMQIPEKCVIPIPSRRHHVFGMDLCLRCLKPVVTAMQSTVKKLKKK